MEGFLEALPSASPLDHWDILHKLWEKAEHHRGGDVQVGRKRVVGRVGRHWWESGKLDTDEGLQGTLRAVLISRSGVAVTKKSFLILIEDQGDGQNRPREPANIP